VELPGGDAAYLKETCKRLNLILDGKPIGTGQRT
jgi:hypothetical protein